MIVKNINTDEKSRLWIVYWALKSRLEAMNSKSPFRIEYNQSLENVIKSFEIQEKSFERLMAISEYYFHCLKKS
jgi:membrane-bound lytic murein transglycosylase D